MAPHTGIVLLDWFLALLQDSGWLVVLAATFFENLAFAGSVTPGDTAVLAAMAFASRDIPVMGAMVAAALAGTIVGSNLTFFLGRRVERSRLEAWGERASRTRVGRFFNLSERSITALEAYFDEHGTRTVFIARFAIGAKNLVPLIAGASRMPILWFELYTTLGAVTYAVAMAILGYVLGHNFDIALRAARLIGWTGLVLLGVLLFVAYSVARQRIDRKHIDQIIEEETGE